jgi:ferredoxin
MTNYKVVVKRNECTSCGNCEDECPEYFELDQEGLSHILNSRRIEDNDVLEIEESDCVLEASLSCPVVCIHVYQDGVEIS